MSGAEVALTAGKVLFSKSSYDFFFKWEHDKSLLDVFKTQINSTKALLNIAEANRKEVDSNFDKWYQTAQYAVLDAEDLLAIIHTDINMENYGLGESSRTIDVIKEKFKYKGKDIVRSIHPYKSTRETEMREAIQKLQSLEAQATHLGIGKNDEMTKLREERMTTSCDFDPSRIIGRSENEKEIIQLLNSREGNDDPLRIISIIGIGGVGKSTLASVVYNGSETSDQIYQLKGWVCVSDKFEIIHVIKSLLESITGGSKAGDNLEFLQKELKTVLQGSRIIVTTREAKVVDIVSSPNFSYELNGLPDAESWSLFQSHAFQNGDSTAYPSLEKIGKDLVRKCKGSPLALKMLGRVLHSKEKDETEWNIVLHSKIWDSTNKILPSLWLSYYHLSMPVKQCFAYLSIFPKDHIFDMDKVVIFWVAEGFVEKPPRSSNGSYDYERVGRTYFKHLISNLFIQKSSIDDSHFVMHDLVHDLAEYVSKDLLVNLTDINIESRRLSFIRNQKVLLSMRSVRKLNRLRTFLPGRVSHSSRGLFTNKASNELLSNFKYLRVLSLENYSISTLPTSVGDMKLLSYLNLASINIKYLPDWISRLYNLQFLQLSKCRRLKRFPPYIYDLVNLRHLIIENPKFKEMPDGIGRLTNLRTLSNYVLGKDKSKQMRDFKRLPNLQGKLRISGLNNVDDVNDVVTASFKNMEYLEELVLEWERIPGREANLDERVLDAIQPHNNLKRLTINGYGGKRLSNWIVKVSPSFTGIVSLNITSCYNLEILPPLGDLRFLKDLKIRGLDSLVSVGVELYGDSDNPFPALQILLMVNNNSMKKWSSPDVGRSGFSSLRELQIVNCIDLAEFPGCFPSLASLKIKHCHKLGNLPSIGNLPFLKDVSIDELHSLESLGEEFYGDACIPFPALEKLSMNNMKTLKNWFFPGGDREGFFSLKELEIRKCPELTKIPYCFPSLIKLEIERCGNLVGLEMHDTIQKGSASSLRTYEHTLQSLSIEHCAKLEEIPSVLVNLLQFKIYDCESLISVPRLQHVQNFDLEKVDALSRVEAELRDCSEVENELGIRGQSVNVAVASLNIVSRQFTAVECFNHDIPNPRISSKDDDEDIHKYDDHVLWLPHTSIYTQICNQNFLKVLRLSDCHFPKSFMNAVLPSTLKRLRFHNCPSLITIPSQFLSGCKKHLEELKLLRCTNLARLPDVLPALEFLQRLNLERCPLIQHFPTSNGLVFSSLIYLCVSDCPALESLPENFHDITTLRTLIIKECPNLIAPRDGFPSKITYLDIKSCGKMDPVSKMKLSKVLTSLEDLTLEGFPETTSLDDCVPVSIENLSIRDFPRLESLSGVLPFLKRLTRFEMINCPLLNQNKSSSTKMKGIFKQLTSCART